VVHRPRAADAYVMEPGVAFAPSDHSCTAIEAAEGATERGKWPRGMTAAKSRGCRRGSFAKVVGTMLWMRRVTSRYRPFRLALPAVATPSATSARVGSRAQKLAIVATAQKHWPSDRVERTDGRKRHDQLDRLSVGQICASDHRRVDNKQAETRKLLSAGESLRTTAKMTDGFALRVDEA